MSNVEFNDEQKVSSLYAKFQSSNELPTLVRWIMRIGLAKTPSTANAILLGIAVLSVIATIVIFYRASGGGFTF